MLRRPAVMAAGAALVLCAGACSRQDAARERQRATQLAAALASLGADTSTPPALAVPASEAAKVRRLLPEWDGYRDTLTACGVALTETWRRIRSGDVAAIGAAALAGWRTASGLAGRSSARMEEVSARFPGSESAAFPDSMSKFEVLNGVSRYAVSYAGLFLRPLQAVVHYGTPTERAAMFEQLAGEQPKAGHPALARWLGELLQSAWAQEEDPSLKERMGQRLGALHLPLSAPPARPAAPPAGGRDSS
jgi:hypothetical protein